MKNPLEYTMLEVDALCHGDPEAPHKELALLVRFVYTKQREAHLYQVAKEREEIKAKQPLTRRKERSLDAELLDAAEIVTL